MFLLHRTLVIFITIAAVLTVSVFAQKRNYRDKEKPEDRRSQPVTIIPQPAPDLLSGEANITVRGNQNPSIKLGLAPNGVTIIEFPAADRFFAIHPGNSDLVTIDDSPTKATDHFIVLRAGSGLTAPGVTGGARGPLTSIIVQMQSGLAITFLIYPVQYVAHQAHRCVVSYDRKEVIAARRTAGLAVNLDGNEDSSTNTASVRITALQSSQTTTQALAATTPDVKTPQSPSLNPVVADIDSSQSLKRNKKDGRDPTRAAMSALAEAIRSPQSFKKWTEPMHGLSLAVSPIRDVDDRSRVVVVAVRNSNNAPARLVSGQPDIYVETLDKKGKPLQVEKIRKLHVETTTVSGALPAGATVYYALVYEAPILGASQRLRVAAGQTNAADEPAYAEIGASSR